MNVDQSLAAAAKFDFKVACHSNNNINITTAPAAGLQENPRLQGVSNVGWSDLSKI